MTQLIIAMIAFVGTHFLMSHPLRATMVKAIGAGGFRIAYSLVAVVTFIWIIRAFGRAPISDPLWPVGNGLLAVASALMLFGSILFAGSWFGNPALPYRPKAKEHAAAPARGAFAITRHPMMWSFAIWALVHLLVSPQPRVVVLTLGIAFMALVGSYGQDHKKKLLMGDAWADWTSRTSFMIFGNQLTRRTGWSTALPGWTAVIAGTAIWLIATWAHPILGAPAAGLWIWLD